MRPVPPARLLMTAVRTASFKSLSPDDAPPELINDARHQGLIRDELRFADIGLLLVRLSRPLIGLKDELQLPYAHRHLDLVLAGMRPGEPPLSGPRFTLRELRGARG